MPLLLSTDRSVLVVVDIQERLMPAITGGSGIVDRASVLIKAAKQLSIPILLTEQYPRGLGVTVAEIAELLPDVPKITKVSFASTGEPAFITALNATGRDQIVLCGLEAHVCLMQTALALRSKGRHVYVVADAIASRRPSDMELALERMRKAGVTVVSTEMVVFEWMEMACTPEFKSISALIR